MTKKDYIILSQALKNSLPISGRAEHIEAWRITVTNVAEKLANTYKNFNKKTFFESL